MKKPVVTSMKNGDWVIRRTKSVVLAKHEPSGEILVMGTSANVQERINLYMNTNPQLFN